MKKIQLGGHQKGKEIRGYALVDDSDFERLKVFNWGMDKDGYALRQYGTHTKINRKLMTHEILGVPKKGYEIDHANMNRIDNRKSNLRYATRSQNGGNKKVRKDSKSGIKGVYFDKRKNKFEAYIAENKKHKHLGYFETAKEAAIIYNNAAIKKFGEFANIN